MKTLTLLFTLIISLGAMDTLHFCVPNFKPYTYREGKEIKGVGVEHVRALFSKLNIPITLSLVPNYGRAVEEVRSGRYDGFFLASQNSERDAFANFSEPLLINNWCWFYLKESSVQPSDVTFKEFATIATQINTNTHKWLNKEGYTVTYATKELTHIMPLLLQKKVDAVFIAEEVFLQLAREQGVDTALFSRTIESQRDFGMYLSKKQDNTLLEKVNQAIKALKKENVQ